MSYKQNQQYPPEGEYSYNKFLTEVECCQKPGFYRFSFNFNGGCRADFSSGEMLLHPMPLLPPGVPVKRISILFGRENEKVYGFRFFDIMNNCLCATPNPKDKHCIQDYILADDERIVGVKSRRLKADNAALQQDLQFVIAKPQY